MNLKSIYFLVLACFAATPTHAAPRVEWYVANKTLNEAGNTLNLGDSLQKIDLIGGWLCSIGPTSKQLPAYEARQVTCQSDDKIISFSVQCEIRKSKDRTQVRFKDLLGKHHDFIEVGCELRE